MQKWRLYIAVVVPLIFMLSLRQVNAEQASADNDLVVHYPVNKYAPLYQHQGEYFFDVLKLALDKSGVPYRFDFFVLPMVNQNRTLQFLKQKELDIFWLTTTVEREEELRPIRIPLFRGLLGLRIPFVSAATPNTLAPIQEVDALKEKYAGQGYGWPDSEVLKFHKFRLMTVSQTEQLYTMLKKQRIDYFPRSVMEIWGEAEMSEELGLVVDKHIALYYPMAVYFFVNKDNDALYEAVSNGLETAIADGSFTQLFNQHFASALARAEFHKRTLFELPNPFLPPETPLAETRYWISTEALRKPPEG